MKVRRIRIVLPARLRPVADVAARTIAREIGEALAGSAPTPKQLAIRIAGNSRPADALARDAGSAAAWQAGATKWR